ncbi:MAG: hypothetical protein HWN65_18630 [Candidatus Helarchaeota archaeon]|nr:hypothetical protein [Candidatus Helarchaeota archaeon]
MRYSSKMKPLSYIAGIFTLIFFFSGITIFVLQVLESPPTPTITNSWFLFLFAIISAATGAAALERATKHFLKKTKDFSSKMNYCYSCGYSLQETGRTEICPECNSKLNILELID